MKAAYSCFTRATRQAQCSPLALAAGVVVLAFVAIGAPALAQHRAQIVAVLRGAAAASLALASAAVLAAAARMVAGTTGAHTDTLPEPGEAAPARDRRPAPMAVPGLHPAYTLRPAGMAAEADALAEDDTGIVVSEKGDIYETAGGWS